jgi:replicative DNA helicase
MIDLPQNKDAEKSVLAAVIRKPAEYLPPLLDKLSSDDFLTPAHGLIYQSVLELFAQTKVISAITVYEDLKAKEKAAEAGGSSTIASVLSGETESVEIVVAHALVIVEKAKVRKAAATIEEAQRSLIGVESKDSAHVLSAGQKLVDLALQAKDYRAVRPAEGISEIERQIRDSIERGGKLIGLETGFPSLDNAMFGFEPCRLYLFAARPAVGKSALLMNLAEHCAVNNDVHTLYISLEMAYDELYLRLICGRANVDTKMIKLGYANEEMLAKIGRVVNDIRKAPLEVDDTAARTIDDLRLRVFKFVKQVPEGKRAIVFIDYLQLLSAPQEKERREREVATISATLKNMAKMFRIPVVAACQLRRAADERKEPRLSDLRESGALEQDADTVVMIHPISNDSKDGEFGLEADESPIRPVVIIIEKNRAGAYARIKMDFNSTYTKFVDNCIQTGYNKGIEKGF